VGLADFFPDVLNGLSATELAANGTWQADTHDR
jgi:hypothetical protein